MRRSKPVPVRIVHDEPQVARQFREPDRMHMSVRQIKNGFIVDRHGYKNGKHYSEEFFTPDAPKFMERGRREDRNERLSKTKL